VLTFTSTLKWLLCPKANEFMSYLGVVSRERLSILINSWDEVSEVDRNMIWEDVLVSFTLLMLCFLIFID